MRLIKVILYHSLKRITNQSQEILLVFQILSRLKFAVETYRNTANNEFALRATGGFRFRTNLSGTTGCNLPAGSGVFNCTSSRYTKENFFEVKGSDIL